MFFTNIRSANQAEKKKKQNVRLFKKGSSLFILILLKMQPHMLPDVSLLSSTAN